MDRFYRGNSTQKLSTTPYEISGLPNINVYSCYNPIDKKVYFSWGENIYNGGIYYTIYDPKISAFAIPATPISEDYQIGIYSYGVYTCTGLNKVFFSWINLEGEGDYKQPWYAIYSFYLSLPQAVKKFSPIKYQR